MASALAARQSPVTFRDPKLLKARGFPSLPYGSLGFSTEICNISSLFLSIILFESIKYCFIQSFFSFKYRPLGAIRMPKFKIYIFHLTFGDLEH